MLMLKDKYFTKLFYIFTVEKVVSCKPETKWKLKLKKIMNSEVFFKGNTVDTSSADQNLTSFVQFARIKNILLVKMSSKTCTIPYFYQTRNCYIIKSSNKITVLNILHIWFYLTINKQLLRNWFLFSMCIWVI